MLDRDGDWLGLREGGVWMIDRMGEELEYRMGALNVQDEGEGGVFVIVRKGAGKEGACPWE